MPTIMPPKMTLTYTYLLLMYILLLLGPVEQNRFLIFGSKTSIYDAIKLAKQMGHIAEINVTVIVDSKPKKIHAIRITNSGSEHFLFAVDRSLFRHDASIVQKNKDFLFPLYRGSSGGEKMERYLMASCAALFALALGGFAYPMRVSPNTTVQSLLAFSNNGTDVLKFANVEQIKSQLKKDYVKKKELDSGRYAGMLVQKNDNKQRMMIYVSPKSVFDWTSHYEKNDRFAYTRFPTNIVDNDFDSNACILIRNQKEFAELILQNEKMENGKRRYLGKGFRHFYLAPYNIFGITMMQRIINDKYNPEILTEAIKQHLLESQLFTPNTDGTVRLFPLKDKDGYPVMIGVWLDSVYLHYYFVTDKKLIGERKCFAIVCYEWQKPFYQKIYPRHPIITLTGDHLSDSVRIASFPQPTNDRSIKSQGSTTAMDDNLSIIQELPAIIIDESGSFNAQALDEFFSEGLSFAE